MYKIEGDRMQLAPGRPCAFGNWLFDTVQGQPVALGIIYLMWQKNRGWEMALRLLDRDPSAIASNRHILLALPGSLVTASSCAEDEGGLYEVVIQKEVDKKVIRKLADKVASVSDHLDGCIKGETRAVQACDSLMADIQSSVVPGKRSGYFGMTRFHRSRSKTHTSSSDEAVNHLVDQLRQTAGGVKGLGVYVVGIVRDVDEVVPKTALHFVEHLLNIAGHFTDSTSGGCNYNIVDRTIYATLLPSCDYKRFLRATDYVAGKLGRRALAWPHHADRVAWNECYAALFPDRFPISG